MCVIGVVVGVLGVLGVAFAGGVWEKMFGRLGSGSDRGIQTGDDSSSSDEEEESDAEIAEAGKSMVFATADDDVADDVAVAKHSHWGPPAEEAYL